MFYLVQIRRDDLNPDLYRRCAIAIGDSEVVYQKEAEKARCSI